MPLSQGFQEGFPILSLPPAGAEEPAPLLRSLPASPREAGSVQEPLGDGRGEDRHPRPEGMEGVQVGVRTPSSAKPEPTGLSQGLPLLACSSPALRRLCPPRGGPEPSGTLQPASPGCCLPSVAETWQSCAACPSGAGAALQSLPPSSSCNCCSPSCRALCSSSLWFPGAPPQVSI